MHCKAQACSAPTALYIASLTSRPSCTTGLKQLLSTRSSTALRSNRNLASRVRGKQQQQQQQGLPSHQQGTWCPRTAVPPARCGCTQPKQCSVQLHNAGTHKSDTRLAARPHAQGVGSTHLHSNSSTCTPAPNACPATSSCSWAAANCNSKPHTPTADQDPFNRLQMQSSTVSCPMSYSCGANAATAPNPMHPGVSSNVFFWGGGLHA